MIGIDSIVVVAHLDDEHANARMLGRVGVVTGIVQPHDHGATDRDPLLEVSFRRDPAGRYTRDYGDAFWSTELELAR